MANPSPAKRYIVAALVGAVIVLTSSVALLLALDHYVHRRFDNVGTLNRAGYRGGVIGKKGPAEYRIGVYGGSVAMGYGTLSDQSIAAYLQKSLRETNQRTTVVNLAKNRDYSVLRLQANYLLFEHLEIDCIVFLLTAHQSTVDLGLARPDLAAGINYANKWPDTARRLFGVPEEYGGRPANVWSTGSLKAAILAYVRNENRGDHGIEEQIDTIRALSDYSGHEPYSNEERRVIRLWNLNNEFSGTLAPVLAIPQYPDSSRADNFVFKRFGYCSHCLRWPGKSTTCWRMTVLQKATGETRFARSSRISSPLIDLPMRMTIDVQFL